jgi:pyruvate/2-oxoglutarate dehydrogenase complex dihydrolipoamide dehydrogenase (E3) component
MSLTDDLRASAKFTGCEQAQRTERLLTELEQALAERDGLWTNLGEETARANALELERDRAVETRENANAVSLRVEAEREALRLERDALQAEVDTLLAAIGRYTCGVPVNARERQLYDTANTIAKRVGYAG